MRGRLLRPKRGGEKDGKKKDWKNKVWKNRVWKNKVWKNGDEGVAELGGCGHGDPFVHAGVRRLRAARGYSLIPLIPPGVQSQVRYSIIFALNETA